MNQSIKNEPQPFGRILQFASSKQEFHIAPIVEAFAPLQLNSRSPFRIVVEFAAKHQRTYINRSSPVSSPALKY